MWLLHYLFFLSFFPTLFLPLLTNFVSFNSVSLMPVLILYGGWRGLLGLTSFLSLPRPVGLPVIISCQSGPSGLISFSSFCGPFASVLLSFFFFLCLWADFPSFPIRLADWALFLSFFLSSSGL